MMRLRFIAWRDRSRLFCAPAGELGAGPQLTAAEGSAVHLLQPVGDPIPREMRRDVLCAALSRVPWVCMQQSRESSGEGIDVAGNGDAAFRRIDVHVGADAAGH